VSAYYVTSEKGFVALGWLGLEWCWWFYLS